MDVARSNLRRLHTLAVRLYTVQYRGSHVKLTTVDKRLLYVMPSPFALFLAFVLRVVSPPLPVFYITSDHIPFG